MKSYLSYIMAIATCLNTVAIYTEKDAPQSKQPITQLTELIQNGVNSLLTKPDVARSSRKHDYEFTNENLNIFGTVELNKFTINAIDTHVNVDMESSNEEAPEDVIFIGLPHHTPKFSLYPDDCGAIFVNVYQNTEFRRLPCHTFRVRKKSSGWNDFVQWTIVNNQRVLFAPVGFKCGPLELPLDPVTHIVEGEFVNTDLDLDGICLIRGQVYIVADNQDVCININKDTVLMNEGNELDSLILLANWDRKITFLVDESMQWRSHLELPFYVVQAGPGKIEFKIVAHEEDIIV